MKPKRIEFPDTIVLLFIIMIVSLVLTWIIPSGQFDRTMVDGRTVVISGSFRYVESRPQGLFGLFTSLPKAFKQSQEIVFFILIVGGTFKLIEESKVLFYWLNKVVSVFHNKEYVIIPLLILMLGLAGTTIGLKEETLMMVNIGISLAIALGFDALTGVAIISLGAAMGFFTSVINPFSVGIAQEIAELPLFSGVGYRVFIFIVYWLITSYYIIRYAKKVKDNPDESLVKEIGYSDLGKSNEDSSVSRAATMLVTITIILLLGMVLYGVFALDWYISEIGALFLLLGLLVGMISGHSPNKITRILIAGMGELIEPAIVLVFARAILVIMEDGYILDTVVYFLTEVVGGLPGIVTVFGFYIIQILINFIIPASTGQAATTMPIMTPIADSLGITRQTSVLAYVLGSGIMDSIIPTSGVLMGQLTIGKIPYKIWIKFVTPLIIIWLVLGAIFIIGAHLIQYGPF